MNNRRVQLMERGEYEIGRADWRRNGFSPSYEGEAKEAYMLGWNDAKAEDLNNPKGRA